MFSAYVWDRRIGGEAMRMDVDSRAFLLPFI